MGRVGYWNYPTINSWTHNLITELAPAPLKKDIETAPVLAGLSMKTFVRSVHYAVANQIQGFLNHGVIFISSDEFG